MKKKKFLNYKIIEMQRKKTGMLFQFCCLAPSDDINKDKNYFNKF